MAKSTEPRRLRWSVPRVDVSTNKWLDLQNDISHSLQLLIRESIQRDGYIDVVNRPIDQLPRRGRPPQSESVGDEPVEDHTAQSSSSETEAQVSAPAPTPAATAEPEPEPEPEGEPTQAPAADSPASEGPMDMDSIFGNRR